ncbi:TNF receptor-associated factor homolog 1a-like [Silene latifolia]|uniref:TNF receptor-associated factor homolog 1a-like n=1 Tax=Silene latifolia TaxID=37657 RepID=UPI003D786CF6
MAGTVASEETSGGRVAGGLSSGSRCQSSDALTEWRSSEQVETGTPSTSPPYWDTDDSDDDGGLKPAELYGKYTWKIEKFSQITKRELRSNAFEVGGYKWYILIYPQGCDVCNHLSLFLCVANHDKLLPGWSHFAQFTIAVVNKDPKKSKYSDTLHRFWKKEHDWGWKKFMELSKVSDGFVDADTLIIKAQVQVIREKADRPFRCLDCQYRRELVRVYLTNVEQICRRFVEERRGKLEKLIEDKARWSSFRAFWLGMDQNTRRRMSREKKDTILKVVVKHFFVEKEVTSTLVMDSLYSGLKALEGQSMKGTAKLLEGEEMPLPIIQTEKDTFVLVDDVLLLLEKAAMEPLPPKDDKGPQNRTKDGGSGEYFTKDSIERDEKRLTELGRRTVEIFVLAHIFSNKIEVAYQEAVALRRQEELIREEAAWLAESEQKAKRGAGEKDKKSKKKQGKKKRNDRRGKDKLKDEKPLVTVHDKQLNANLSSGGKDKLKDDVLEDVSDVSDIAECAVDTLQLDSEDRDGSPINWDTDTSEVQPPAEASGSEVSSISTVHNGGMDKRNSSVMDDSSSTCSTDSTPSVVTNGSYRSNSFVNYSNRKSPARGKNQRGKSTFEDCSGPNEADSRRSQPAEVHLQYDASPRRKIAEANESVGAITSLQDRTKWPELNAIKKEDEILLSQRKQNKENIKTGSKGKEAATIRTSKSPPRNTTSVTALQPKPDLKTVHPADMPLPIKTPSNEEQQTDKATSSSNTPVTANCSRVNSTMVTISKPTEKPTVQQSVGLSRPLSAPLIPATLAATPVVSMVQVSAPSSPLIPRSVSATGRLVQDPSLATAPAFVPQSYRNAIAGNSFTPTSGGFTHAPTPSVNSTVNMPNPVFLSHTSERNGTTFNAPPQEDIFRGQTWMDSPQRDVSRSSMFDSPSMGNDSIRHFDLYRPANNGYNSHFPSELLAGTSGRSVQTPLADEFPHLDIINDLLDDEQVIGRSHRGMAFPGTGNGGPSATLFNRQFTYPADISLSSNEASMGFRQDYGPNSPYDSMREFNTQGNSIPYLNGQIDNLTPNQWQLLGPDLSLLGMRNSGADGYSYNVPEYSNMACGVNGYAMFRPSNGH